MFGYFSQKAIDAGSISSIYADDQGREFEVTFVNQVLENIEHQWDDVIFLGEVGQWVRRGNKGTDFIFDDGKRYFIQYRISSVENLQNNDGREVMSSDIPMIVSRKS